MSTDYRTALVEFIRAEARPPDKFSHQARLYQLASMIGRAEGRAFDDDVVFAAAWLHDLGVFIGHRPEDVKTLAAWDHVAYAIAKAPDVLGRLGFPGHKVAAVLEVIRTHLPTAAPSSFEGEILRDADILEQLGAAGLLRVVSKVGRDTRFVTFQDALRILRHNVEQLPGKLRLESARRLAPERVRFLREFLERAAKETGEIPW
jgi:uncharacterized protein